MNKRYLGILCILLAAVMVVGTGCMRVVEKVAEEVIDRLGTETSSSEQAEMPSLSFDDKEESETSAPFDNSSENTSDAPTETDPDSYEEGDSEWMWGEVGDADSLPLDFSDSAYEVNDCTAMECALDLNGDSVTELTVRVGEGYREHQLLVSTEAMDFECYFGEEGLDLTRAMVADLDPNDGAIEIFVSGDWASDDYVTFAWRYDGAQLIEIADAELGYAGGTYGEINGFSGNCILLRRDIEVMGTWWGEQAYVLEDRDGMLSMVKHGYWMHTDPLYEKAPLVVAKDLTVFLYDGQELVVPAGETLEIVFVADNDSFYEVNCLLADGTQVYLIAELCTEDDWYVFYINGEPEAYWFEELPYSG